MASDILGQEWSISEKGLDLITESKTINDKAKVMKNALNSDLKEIGSPVLVKILNKNNVSQVVLQIQKIRNISAPKANEKSQVAPRMLKLVLTDGDTYIQAIETAPIPSLNSDKTPPGSKLLIRSAKISSGYLLLDANNCSLLGGQVSALYEKWELAKSVQYHTRQNVASGDGPPAWVNFGTKIHSDIPDKQFKSLDNKTQEVKENSKFEQQRQGAIAEATSGAVKKVFGGGVKQQVQATVPKYNKKPNDYQNKDRKSIKTKNFNVKDEEEKPQKPPERVSLFDFLEDKLPANESPKESNKYSMNYQQNNKNPNSYRAKNESRHQNTPSFKPYNSFNQNTFEKSYNKPHFEQNNSFRVKNNYYNRQRNETQVSQNNSPTTKNEEVNGLSNNLEKMSLNSQFASRSLKQHLNLGPQKRNNVDNAEPIKWKVGDDCVAKYWEDGKFYNANITAITDKTCVVKFKGYGNIEEVLKTDCLPATGNETNKKQHNTGTIEFRRNTRTYRRQ